MVKAKAFTRDCAMKVAIAALCVVMMMDVPSGRPPTGPLQRVEPRVYDFNFNVTVSTVWQVSQFLGERRHLASSQKNRLRR